LINEANKKLQENKLNQITKSSKLGSENPYTLIKNYTREWKKKDYDLDDIDDLINEKENVNLLNKVKTHKVSLNLKRKTKVEIDKKSYGKRESNQ
jgi:hypothetical protein